MQLAVNRPLDRRALPGQLPFLANPALLRLLLHQRALLERRTFRDLSRLIHQYILHWATQHLFAPRGADRDCYFRGTT